MTMVAAIGLLEIGKTIYREGVPYARIEDGHNF
jgi:hypothetical protein